MTTKNKNIEKIADANPAHRFSSRLEVSGENAVIIKNGLDKKMKDDNRKTYNNTIEAALVEYFNSVNQKK